MLFEKVFKIIEKSNSSVAACFALNHEEIEEIFKIAVSHGIFDEKSYGFHDRKNSVYGLISTLFDFKNK